MKKGDSNRPPVPEAELRSALMLMDSRARARLHRAAYICWSSYRAFAEGRQPLDLLQEAVLRTLDGRRSWNRDRVTIVGHLIGVMESLANHWAERYGDDVRNVPAGQSEQGDPDFNSGPDGWAGDARDDSASVEKITHARLQLERIEKGLSGDAALLRFLREVMDPTREHRGGARLQEALSLSTSEYRALEARFWRRVERILLEGVSK